MKKTFLKTAILGLMIASLFSLSLISCSGGKDKKDAKDTTKTDTIAKTTELKGDLEGAKKIVEEFLKKGADCMALTMKLIPTLEDCKAYVAKEEDAQKVYDYMMEGKSKIQKDNKAIQPKDGQDSYLIYSATTDKMKEKEWSGDLDKFPGGYREASAKLKPGVTVYLFKLVKKGEEKGMRYDGLVFVNGHWVIFPKVYRAFKEELKSKPTKK